jgi:cytochrome P450
MVFRDPPDHTRLRRLFNKVFTTRSVEALRPNIEDTISFLFDAMDAKAAAGQPLDWIADFAYPLPATVIMDLLGVPRQDLHRVKVWSDEIALFIGTAQAAADKYQRAEAGAKAMADYFRDMVDERTAAPRDDLISQLVLARDEREALSADEVIGTCIMLLFAGHETTTNLIGNGFYYTMKFRDQWERVKQDPSLVDSAIEEWLRYDGPSGALARVVAQDGEFNERQLKKGQRVFAFLNSANRDEAQFANPDTFDVGRNPNPHLTFGHGIHFCLGAPLARLEAQMALHRLAERYSHICLASGPPLWNDSLILRGTKALPIHLQ